MTGLPNNPTLLAFVDERTERLHSLTSRWIVGCCLFGRDRWLASHEQEFAVGGVRVKRRLEEIYKLLNAVGGVAVLVYADVPQELTPHREIDGTTDICKMSRTDNIWSLTVLSALTASIAWLQHSSVPIGNIEIYYDRKDLTAHHRAQFENVLRQRLPEWAREAAEIQPSTFPTDYSSLRIVGIEGVAKPQRGQQPNALQAGTNLAHHLCGQSMKVIHRGSDKRVLVQDHTEVVCDVISKFAPIGTKGANP